MVTLADVAKKAGVSVMSASNALRGKPHVSATTRAKVLAAASALNYQVNVAAQSLRSGRTGLIGLAVPDLSMPFHATLAKELTAAAAARNIQVMVQQTHSMPATEQEILRRAASSLVDGTIICTVGQSPRELEESARGHAVVLFDEQIDHTSLDIISCPNRAGSQAAITHLITKGCRHIAIVGTAPQGAGLSPIPGDGPDHRWEGAIDATRSHPDVVLTPVPCSWDAPSARLALGSFLAVDRSIDGVFAMTDSMALGVLRAISDYGLRSPHDIRVIGFDGITEGKIATPSLSTIDVNISLLARTCLEMLTTRMDHPLNKLPGRRFTPPYTLIERESSR